MDQQGSEQATGKYSFNCRQLLWQITENRHFLGKNQIFGLKLTCLTIKDQFIWIFGTKKSWFYEKIEFYGQDNMNPWQGGDAHPPHNVSSWCDVWPHCSQRSVRENDQCLMSYTGQVNLNPTWLLSFSIILKIHMTNDVKFTDELMEFISPTGQRDWLWQGKMFILNFLISLFNLSTSSFSPSFAS